MASFRNSIVARMILSFLRGHWPFICCCLSLYTVFLGEEKEGSEDKSYRNATVADFQVTKASTVDSKKGHSSCKKQYVKNDQ